MMKRAFTLLELLTVVAIMGILGSIAVAGYSAVTRGMTERGALDAAANIAELTFLRSKIDHCRTYLFLFTEVLSADGDEEVANVAGLAVAVKQAGRVSAIDGNDIFDEFGDLDQEFLSLRDKNGQPLTEAEYEKASTRFRIYNLNRKEFTVVRNGVFNDDVTEPDLEDGRTHQPALFGFRKISGADFKVGEAYGREFSAIRLPVGFTFEKGKTRYSKDDVGLKLISGTSCHMFDPQRSNDRISLDIYRRKVNGEFQKVENN